MTTLAQALGLMAKSSFSVGQPLQSRTKNTGSLRYHDFTAYYKERASSLIMPTIPNVAPECVFCNKL